jgi:nucleotide-binding universal stress UspA family protein
MTYATLLVHLQSGQSNAALLTVAGQFADRFKAHVIGIAACQPLMVVSGDGMVAGDVYADDQRRITADLQTAQAEFRDALRGRSTWLEWRSEVTLMPPASYLSDHARSADLVMTTSVPSDTFDLSRAANSGSLVMEAGRPVFIVPPDAQPMHFHGALVGWKDTRECRRAAADALPLLKQTERVTVLEIAAIDDLDAAQARVSDVVTWLERHGVMADTRIERANGHDADQLHAVADDLDADILVAGAYGHSRLREWVIGGVTRDLLLECQRGVLVSH